MFFLKFYLGLEVFYYLIYPLFFYSFLLDLKDFYQAINENINTTFSWIKLISKIESNYNDLLIRPGLFIKEEKTSLFIFWFFYFFIQNSYLPYFQVQHFLPLL